MVNLVHLVGLHCGRELGGFGDISGNENNLAEDVGNSVLVGVAVKKNQVLAHDSLFAHQVARQKSVAKLELRILQFSRCERCERLRVASTVESQSGAVPIGYLCTLGWGTCTINLCRSSRYYLPRRSF